MLRHHDARSISKNPRDAGARHIYALDCLRIFAAVLVLLNHFAEFKIPGLTSSDDGRAAYEFLNVFNGVGSVGVEIFFVISGFVISASAERGFGKAFALRFALLRCKRLLPVLWISGLISLAVRAFDTGLSSELIFQYIRYALLSPSGPYIDGVVWSLVVEAVFYAVIGLVILSRNPRRFYVLSIVLSLLSIAYNIVYMSIYVSVDIYHSAAFAFITKFTFKVILLKYGIFFTLGMFIRAGSKNLGFLVKYVLVPCIFVSCLAEIYTASLGISPLAASMRCVIWVVGVGCLIAGIKRDPLASTTHDKTKTFIRWLGNISYPIYLNHYTTGKFLTEKLEYLDDTTRFLLIFFLIIGISHIVELLAAKIVSINLRDESTIVKNNAQQKGNQFR